MVLAFPSSPSLGQIYQLWQFDGQKWICRCSGAGGTGGGEADIIGNGVIGMPSRTFVFNNSGTYTPSQGITSIIVECYGGGGGGGECLANTEGGGAGGGGSGGYSRIVLLPNQIGTSQTVTIGAGGAGGVGGVSGAGDGGATSFGGLCIANGGGAGSDFHPSGQGLWGGGGNGAGSGTGDFAMPGQPGGDGKVLGIESSGNNLAVLGGTGGAIMGGGGQCQGPVGLGQTSVGLDAVANTGAGGAGAAAFAGASTLVANGGAGGSGRCIVTEYQPSTA